MAGGHGQGYYAGASVHHSGPRAGHDPRGVDAPVSPVERTRGHAGRALAVSGVAIAVLLLGLWGASVFTSRQDSFDVGLGDQTFQGGDAERLAAEIDERGPILYPDVSGGGDRDIILQHLGDDPEEGWYAFRAQPVDKGRDCTWEWQEDEELFRARCDESLTAPADGDGLEQFPVEVEDGKLDVDLNHERRATTTDAPRSTAVESGDAPGTAGP